MKTKRFLAVALASTMALGGTITANAQTIDVTGDTATGSSPTSFSVTADMLEGGDLVITVPDGLTLAQNEGKTAFESSANVNAKGNINPAKQVVVTTPTDITYSHADDNSVTADGTVTFGTEDGTNQKTSWSAKELHDGGTSGVNKPISATVPMTEVEYIDTYNATVHYNISVEAKEKVAGVYNASGDLLADWATLKTKGLDMSEHASADPYGEKRLRAVLDSLGHTDTTTEVIVPDTETVIGDWALSDLTEVTTITLPSTVTHIGDYALSGNAKLTGIALPDSITYMGQGVITGDSLITTINIPSSVTTLSEGTFTTTRDWDDEKDCRVSGCTLTSVTYKGTTYTNSTDAGNALVGNVTNYGLGVFDISTACIWGYNQSTGAVTWGN